MDIHTVIFDLDRVITDTAEYHFRAWKHLANEERIPFAREDSDAIRGESRRESQDRRLNDHEISESAAEQWLARKNGYYLKDTEQLTPENRLAGATAFLDAARRAGLKLAIASASKNARLVLKRLELTEHFEVIGDGHSVAKSKPAPDLFVWVTNSLGFRAHEAVVFEDAEAGSDAAKRAGCLTVGIGGANVSHAEIHLADGRENAQPDLILSQFEAIRSTHG